MKRLILLSLAALPLFAFGINFILADYEYYGDGYAYDEYWCDYPCDGYWVYYPDGYYCVHYVWWYPWWWDWYWWRCYWCHHFCWNFFYCGFYVVWYEDGCWWWRPRYGRWVRYRLPYTYKEIRYRARKYGIKLPKKPPREINVPYKENEIKRLVRQKDPELFARVEKEHRSGNLERLRKEYDARIKREVKATDTGYRIHHKESGLIKKTEPHRVSEGIEKKHYDTDREEGLEKETGIHIIKKKNVIKKGKAIDQRFDDDEKDTHFNYPKRSTKRLINDEKEKTRFDRNRVPESKQHYNRNHTMGRER